VSTHAEVVVTGLMFPEGPVWCDDGTVVCTSVAEGALYRVWPQHHRAERIAVTGGGANAAAPVDDGGFLVTQNGGIDFRGLGLYAEAPPYRPAEAGLQRVAPDGTATYVAIGGFNAPNDLVVAPDGTVYFTDPPQHPPPPEPVGRVHALRPDGTTEVVASGFSYCNGIALEADATLVVIEGRGLLRLLADGSREWVTPELGTGGGDGMCIDADGNFYVAATTGHGVRVLDPAGLEVEFLDIAAPFEGPAVTTNCCFGGADRRTLFATDGIPGQLVAWEHMAVRGAEVHAWPAPGRRW